jgi:parallel beta-helix repeat protein
VKGAATPVIDGNTVGGAGVIGVLYGDTATGTLSNNTIDKMAVGIQLGNNAAPKVLNNTLTNIALTSIVYADQSGGLVQGNHCKSTTASGISLTNQAKPTLGTNDCSISSSG